MAESNQVLLTYKDIKEANPDWTEKMIEDYLSMKRDLSSATVISEQGASMAVLQAQLNDIRAQIGSGNALTWDDTGFTWDSTKHSFDQTEA